MKNTHHPFSGEHLPEHPRRLTKGSEAHVRIEDFQTLFGDQFDRLMEGFNLNGESSDMD